MPDAPEVPDALALPARCRCCEAELRGQWCHACGQNNRHGRLSVGALVGEVAEGLLNVDGRVFRTFWGLSVRPGQLIREYLGGRRVPYLHPFKYALGVVAGVFFAFELIRWKTGQVREGPIEPDDSQLLILALTPLLAIYLRLLFARGPVPVAIEGQPPTNPKAGFNLIEHFVVALYLSGHGILLTTLLSFVTRAFGVPGYTGMYIQLFAWLVYASWVATQTYQTRWWTTIPRILVLVFVSALSLAAGVLAISPEIRDALLIPAQQSRERQPERD